MPGKPCYFAVMPDPEVEDSYMKIHGKYCFYIKFGDGEFRDAYATTNPVARGYENRESDVERLDTVDNTGKKINPRLGKHLEWTYIKDVYRGTDGDSTEWHFITAKTLGSLEPLREVLAKLGGMFTEYDWGDKSQSVKAFEAEWNALKKKKDDDTYVIT